MNDLVKNLMLWVVVAVVLMVVFQSFSPKSAATQALTYDQFVQEVQGDRVAKVTIAEDRTTIAGERKDGSRFTTYAPGDKDLVNDLLNHGVTTVQTPPSSGLSLGMIWSTCCRGCCHRHLGVLCGRCNGRGQGA